MYYAMGNKPSFLSKHNICQIIHQSADCEEEQEKRWKYSDQRWIYRNESILMRDVYYLHREGLLCGQDLRILEKRIPVPFWFSDN